MLASIRHAVRPASRLRLTALVAVVGLSTLSVNLGLAPGAQADDAHLVTLCHANAPSKWNDITVDKSSVDRASGHAEHADDIIPSFAAVDDTPAFAGLNLGTVFAGWTGAQILAAGCALPERPAKPAPVVSTSVSEGTPDCAAGVVEVTTRTTTTDWVWDESAGTWVAGTPQVEEASSTREATSAECVVLPAKPAPVVSTSVSEGTPDCAAGVVEVTTRTTTTDWVWDESAGTWVAGTPQVEEASSTRVATSAECVVLPAKPAPVVSTSVSEGTPDCAAGVVEVTTRTTTTDWVWDESAGTWVAGTPQVEEASSTRVATSAECVVLPAKPAPVVSTSVSEGTPDCAAGVVEVTTRTTTTDWVWDESAGTWVAGTPQVEEASSTRVATSAECSGTDPGSSSGPSQGGGTTDATQSSRTVHRAAAKVNKVPAAATDGADLLASGGSARLPQLLGWAMLAAAAGLLWSGRRWARRAA